MEATEEISMNGAELPDAFRDPMAELHELLHPPLELVALEPIMVQAAPPDTTGALLANAGDDLTVQSVGTLAARVTNHDMELSCVMHLEQLVGKVGPRP